MKTILEKEKFLCEDVIGVFKHYNTMPKGIIPVSIAEYGYALIGYQKRKDSMEITDISDLITEGATLFYKLWNLKEFDMQLETANENDLFDLEIEDILEAMTDEQKKEIEDLKNLLWNEIFGKPEIRDGVPKSCINCKNNVEYPPAHTCDVCTSLDEETYCMWEPIK